MGAEESSDDEVESVRSVHTEFHGKEFYSVKKIPPSSAECEKQTSAAGKKHTLHKVLAHTRDKTVIIVISFDTVRGFQHFESWPPHTLA